MHFTNDMWHNNRSFEIKIIKEFKMMKGPLIVEHPIISKVHRYKMWDITILVELI